MHIYYHRTNRLLWNFFFYLTPKWSKSCPQSLPFEFSEKKSNFDLILRQMWRDSYCICQWNTDKMPSQVIKQGNNSLQGGRNCFWLCPRHRPSLFQGRLCAGRWHLWAGTPPFGWTLWHADSSDQDPVRPTGLPCYSPRRLELAPYTHLRSTSVSREQFRDGLKTHLFTHAYAFLWELHV